MDQGMFSGAFKGLGCLIGCAAFLLVALSVSTVTLLVLLLRA